MSVTIHPVLDVGGWEPTSPVCAHRGSIPRSALLGKPIRKVPTIPVGISNTSRGGFTWGSHRAKKVEMMEMVEMEMMEGAPQRGLHCRSAEDMENQRDPGEEMGSLGEEVASPEGGDGVSR